MLWVIAAVAAGGVAVWAYLVRERLGLAGAGFVLLRGLAFVTLLALLANSPLARRAAAAPATVLLDASLSMQAGSVPWPAVLDSARALAGRDGLVLRFGGAVAPFDSTPPDGGASRLREALGVAAARGGGTVVLTDGELDDWETVPDAVRRRAELVILPRDSTPGLALTEVATERRVLTGDSVTLTLEVASWGGLPDTAGVLLVRSAGRDLLRRSLPVPRGEGRGRRTVGLPPGTLPPGQHVLDVSVTADGDPVADDNLRQRVVEIAALPAAVLVADPVDWEARFLARELAEIVPGGLEAFGRLGAGRWVDLRTQAPVSPERVARLSRTAAVAVTRGAAVAAARRTWRWTVGDDGLGGDWYVTGDLAASALVPRLAGVTWDSLPPVRGVGTAGLPGYEPILSARLGRRGAQRVVLAARDSAGRRDLVTTAEGFWRWAFRGGAEREAYRTLLAAGVEWLLRGATGGQDGPVAVATTVTRGLPVPLRWTADEIPADSVTITFAGPDTVTRRVGFGPDGAAAVALPVGVYRWRMEGMPGAAGVTVVESFSPEFVPREPAAAAGTTPAAGAAVRVPIRELWWVFGVAAFALIAEWAWRLRRGLP